MQRDYLRDLVLGQYRFKNQTTMAAVASCWRHDTVPNLTGAGIAQRTSRSDVVTAT